MKIAISVLLMVVVLTLVESSMYDTKTHVDQLRLKRDLNDKSVQQDLGNGQRRYIRDFNKKHHVHMSSERVPAARVARNAETLKNVHERMFPEAEDAGK